MTARDTLASWAEKARLVGRRYRAQADKNEIGACLLEAYAILPEDQAAERVAFVRRANADLVAFWEGTS